MTDDVATQVDALLPKRRGHFAYESGHHGELWLDLERLLLHPERVAPLSGLLAERLAQLRPDFVCGPLVEGAFVALQVAERLRVPFGYTTPVTREDGDSLFPVDYPIPRALHAELRGRRVAVVNDVINAGSAVRGTLASLAGCGAEPVAIGALAAYGDAAARLAAGAGAALLVLATFQSPIFEPGACPLCARGVPLDAD